jgi:hypothetical protein
VPGSAAFASLVQFLVGPDDGPGAESFDTLVCAPEWLRDQAAIVDDRHHLIVPRYDYDAILRFVEDFLETCEGKDWDEVACKVSRLGHWEFEDYQEYRT